MLEDKIGLADVAEAKIYAIRYWAETPYEPNVTFRTSSVEALRGMVASGMGIAILSDMVYRPWSLEGQRIEVRTLSDGVHTMDVGLVWRRDAEVSEPTRAFCEYLTHSFSSGMPQLPG